MTRCWGLPGGQFQVLLFKDDSFGTRRTKPSKHWGVGSWQCEGGGGGDDGDGDGDDGDFVDAKGLC